MALKAIYEKLDDVPEHFHELYTERNGKFELSGIEGVKTQADVDRLGTSLTKERSEHKASKERLALWGDLKPEDVQAKLDLIPELEARASAVDPAKTQQLVDAQVATKLQPLTRERDKLKSDLDQISTKLSGAIQRERTRTIHDVVREARRELKVIDSAEEDVLFAAERMLEIVEDGDSLKVVARDGVGVTPGVDAKTWLLEMQPKRTHWWPDSIGGGAKGAAGGGGVANPWKRDSWDHLKQAEYARTNGAERAAALAKAAGSQIGAFNPPAK